MPDANFVQEINFNPQDMNDVIQWIGRLKVQAENLGFLPGSSPSTRITNECDKVISFLKGGAGHRRRLPGTRRAVVHKFKFGMDPETRQPHKGYLTTGFFEDDEPGEIFISMKKTGSTVSGVLDCLAIVVSMALQHGVPLKTICSKLTHVRFEPDGFSGEEFGFAKSIVDYIFRYLEARYVVPEVKAEPNNS